MQSFYTARLHTPTTGDEQQQRDSSEAPTRQLREYSLTVTPQAIYHAPLTYDKMARYERQAAARATQLRQSKWSEDSPAG